EDGIRDKLVTGVQTCALPISLVNYAKLIVQELRDNMVRAEGDYSPDKINGKIQQAELAKVHTMLVVGARDMQAGAISVRLHGKEIGRASCRERVQIWESAGSV